MKNVWMSLPALFLTTAAVGQTSSLGTVNDASAAQIARARAAIAREGYQPTVLQFAQDNNLFFTATKGGNTYEITVTPRDQIYVSVGLPSHAPAS